MTVNDRYSFPRWPWAFLIAAALIAFIEWGNIALDPYFYTLETQTGRAAAAGLDGFRIKVKNEFAQTPGENFDVLVMGDSYMMSGVHPLYVEQWTGLKTFNLSSFGDHGVFTGYCLLKNYLRSHAPPKMIFIGYQWDTLGRTQILPEFMYDLRQGNFLELTREFGWAQGLKFQIPSLKHQGLFKRIIQTGSIPETLSKDLSAGLTDQVIRLRGYYAPRARLAVGEGVTERDYNSKSRFKVSPSSRANLGRILHLARQYNIQVFYVMPTLSRDWLALYQQHGAWAAYAQFLADLNRRFPQMRVLHFQDRILDLSVYADRLHLNEPGTALLTSAISETINALQSTPPIPQ